MQWYHGTLDRVESGAILRQYASKLAENLKTESPTTGATSSDDENANTNESESETLTSGIFLVRYSKKENNFVLTLLDNDQLKNFIIKKHVSSGVNDECFFHHFINRQPSNAHFQMKYSYIDQGPYMPSLEHLIQHYMRFSDGLPVNLRYPAPPLPKPPLPQANKFFNTIATDSSDRGGERKMSMDQFPVAMKRTQRNLSVPSDDLMNQVGILSTSPTASKMENRTSPTASSNKKSSVKSPSDNTKFLSLRLPKKNIIDGMLSLTRSKNAKETKKNVGDSVVNTSVTSVDNSDHSSILQSPENVSQSLRNLTFAADFKPNELLYKVPTNNGMVTADDKLNKNGPSNNATTDDDDLFTQSDTLITHYNDTYDKENAIEEIYFIDAPTKTISAQSINYVPFQQIPYFPDGTPYTSDDRPTASNLTAKELRSNNVHSIISSTSNESDFILSLQCQSSTNYYIPKSSIIQNESLGSGEFGNVYKGLIKCDPSNANANSDIPVAIKMLQDEHCKQDRAAFLREASVMIKLSHHCIVKLIGISKVRAIAGSKTM